MELEWDERNLHHALVDRPHGLTPQIAAEVASGSPKWFLNSPGEGRSGSDRIIGPDSSGQFWTIILLHRGGDTWRPITGYPSRNSQIRLYEEQ